MVRSGLRAAAAVAAFLTAAAGVAQPPKAGDPPADAKAVTTKPTKAAPAAAIPFRKALGLSYPSLSTLGGRIDAARRAGDPVALAHAAGELKVAEKVSGKTAPLTSPQVLSEAAELARLRKQEAELKAVLEISNQVNDAQENVAALKREIDTTQGLTAAAKAALTKKQEPTNAPRRVVVNNYTTQYIDVQVNGYLKGQVLPGTSQTFTIDQIWNPIVLKGWGDSDETTFGPVVLQGRWSTYTWNINGDDGIPNTP